MKWKGLKRELLDLKCNKKNKKDNNNYNNKKKDKKSISKTFSISRSSTSPPQRDQSHESNSSKDCKRRSVHKHSTRLTKLKWRGSRRRKRSRDWERRWYSEHNLLRSIRIVVAVMLYRVKVTVRYLLCQRNRSYILLIEHSSRKTLIWITEFEKQLAYMIKEKMKLRLYLKLKIILLNIYYYQ